MAAEKFYNNNRVTLPEGYDPYDMALKKQLHEKADEKNFITTVKGQPVLACGAKKPSSGKLCSSIAGQQTSHVGYGRCKYHGGASTGPVTPEGKAIAAQNSRIHGLYAAVLSPTELKYYETFQKNKELGLEHEIYVLKAKIMSYLEQWRNKWDAIAKKEGADVADHKTKVLYKESEGNSTSTAYYHAMTIEDKPLMRALETLGRLIEKQARLNPDNGDDLLQQINKELRDASYGQVNLSWGAGPAQQRKENSKK